MIGLTLKRIIYGRYFASASEGLICEDGLYMGELILLMNFTFGKGTPMIKKL